MIQYYNLFHNFMMYHRNKYLREQNEFILLLL